MKFTPFFHKIQNKIRIFNEYTVNKRKMVFGSINTGCYYPLKVTCFVLISFTHDK